MRNPRLRWARALLAVAAGSLAFGDLAAGASPGLRVSGMTFVGSRGGESELIVHATGALFHPDTGMADLENVRASVSDDQDPDSFTMKCDRAELNVDTNDFTARGNVEGLTGEGQRYQTPWVRYDHARSMLSTEAPVVMNDKSGTFRGEGFRYYLEERRFELLGNVTVDQVP